MSIKQELNLNIIPGGITPVIYVCQNDVGVRVLKFVIYKDGAPYDYTYADTNFYICGTKPNGETFKTIFNKIRNEYIYDVVREDWTDVAGDVYCNIEMIENGTDRTGSQAFILRVQPDAKGEI